MIFTRLQLVNFGLFKGKHEINLRPEASSSSVILFGGLNGRGKTTILDAIQLCLYGDQARCSHRGNLSYSKFLKNSIHWRSKAEEGASIELEFTYKHEHQEHTYRIKRYWCLHGKKLLEKVDAFTDGEHDPFLTDSFEEWILNILPPRLAELFFFDGEEIKEYAKPEKLPELLKNSLSSLLGLDLIDTLEQDLRILDTRIRRRLEEATQDSVCAELEKELDSIRKQQEKIPLEKVKIHGEIHNCKNRLSKTEDEFRSHGGELWAQKQSLDEKNLFLRAELKSSFKSGTKLEAQAEPPMESKLRNIAAGLLPLAVIKVQVSTVLTRAEQESDIQDARALQDLLLKRDQELTLFMKDNLKLSAKIRKQVEEYLKNDLNERTWGAHGELIFGLDKDLAELCHKMQELLIPSQIEMARPLVHRAIEVRTLLTDLERKLASLPENETIIPIQKNILALKSKIDVHESKILLLKAELEELKIQEQKIKDQIDDRLVKETKGKLELEEDQRKRTYIEKSMKTLRKYRVRLVTKRILEITDQIHASVSQLLQKGQLIQKISIDPIDFTMKIFDSSDVEVELNKLSAGERQLLAIAIIWGITKCADTPLPAIIDTPLSRLDSIHRTNLVSDYFPYASDQVILLSTDEEIYGEYYNKLKPNLAHEYGLVFNESTNCTTVEVGYPFRT
jgi:DNA sulfur modification protein DndD